MECPKCHGDKGVVFCDDPRYVQCVLCEALLTGPVHGDWILAETVESKQAAEPEDPELIVRAFGRIIERFISGCTNAELKLLDERYPNNTAIRKEIERRKILSER